ncbi:MAG: carboxypeptidase regulatory-like domain-containing protein [Candidatus Hydrogenedentes bacterium]|nr:carboxypeptidase regulatory-like domain-containing protein [Candidatus Hydrogenedentota bacterium]
MRVVRIALVTVVGLAMAGAVTLFLLYVRQSPSESAMQNAQVSLPVDVSQLTQLPSPATPNAPGVQDETVNAPAETTGLRVYGTVIDQVTGQPVPGATISVEDFTHGGISAFANPQVQKLTEDSMASSMADLEDSLKAQLQAAMGSQSSMAQGGLGGKLPTTQADEKGSYTFTLSDMLAGSNITCLASGYVMQIKETGEPASDSVRVDFALAKGATISGKVTDVETGAAIEGVTIALSEARDSGFEPAFGMYFTSQDEFLEKNVNGLTAGDGTYRLEGVPEGNYKVLALAGELGYVDDPATAKVVNVAAGSQHDAVDFALQHGGTVEGVVRDEEGKPISEAFAVLALADSDFTVSYGPEAMLQWTGGGSSLTDSDGRFLIAGLAFDKPYYVSVQHEDRVTAKSAEFRVTKGNSAHQLEITLVSGCSVSGVAKLEDNSLAANYVLHLVPAGEESISFDSSDITQADDQGHFAFKHVPAGTYRLGPDVGFEASEEEDKNALILTVDGKTDVANLELRISAAAMRERSGVIRGVVFDPDGKPAEGVEIDADREPHGMGFAYSDADGSFTIDEIPEGTYKVKGSSAAGVAIATDVKTGTSITLQLRPMPSLTGIVVDAAGNAVQNCNVRLAVSKKEADEAEDPISQLFSSFPDMFSDGGTGSTATDESGSFTFKNVEPGEYIVEARSALKGAGESTSFTVVENATLPHMTIRLEPGVTFSGSAVDVKGTPIPGATIHLKPAGASEFMAVFGDPGFSDIFGGKGSGSATSDNQGRFSIPNVIAGAYTVEGQHPAYAPFRQFRVDVPKGTGVVDYVARFSRGGGAKGTYSIGGKPIADAELQLAGPNGVTSIKTDAQGQFEVSGLAVGRYAVLNMYGEEPGGVSIAPRVFTVTDEQITSVSLGDGAGTRVSGKLNGSFPHPGTYVVISKPDSGSAASPSAEDPLDYLAHIAGMGSGQVTAEVTKEGTFAFAGLEPGEYDIEIFSEDLSAMSELMENDSIEALSLENLPIEEPKPLVTQHITVGTEPLQLEFAVPDAPPSK